MSFRAPSYLKESRARAGLGKLESDAKASIGTTGSMVLNLGFNWWAYGENMDGGGWAIIRS